MCAYHECGLEARSVVQEYAKSQDQLTHFLTYADNNAVGYFSKQGFTKEITLDKEWVSPFPLCLPTFLVTAVLSTS